MDEFIKTKVRLLCNVLAFKDKENEGYVSKPEIPYILRSFLQFPSQQNIVDEVIPAIEKLETVSIKNMQNCQIEAIEKYMIDVLKKDTYSSYDKDYLYKAFKALDTNNEGFIDLHTMFYLFKNFGIKFTKQNIKDMEEFCIENENDLLEPLNIQIEDNSDSLKRHDQYTTRKFYYENYIRKIDMENKSRFNEIMSEFLAFQSTFIDTFEVIDKTIAKPPKKKN